MRQPLFEFDDCLSDEKPKAEALVEGFKIIFRVPGFVRPVLFAGAVKIRMPSLGMALSVMMPRSAGIGGADEGDFKVLQLFDAHVTTPCRPSLTIALFLFCSTYIKNLSNMFKFIPILFSKLVFVNLQTLALESSSKRDHVVMEII